ncbi:twin-arginine translocase TatA/TatE family subunit [Actinopolymorpha rutila]|uniref:Sec-independent protein translocase protein TatA n=1 Tax=Actinopolymorpha rutila TaxID=446787 RepID=A0A852ZNV5_9ACTN|nr:twin-arginine translocase TatA/TatE family subunit [Actinopolymorpha rutila]NYH91159.1 sec-independent protein translocase protein TatA [Actinopolymorpha rutila]
MLGSLGAPELLIIGIVLVVLFGASRLPQTAKGLAQSLRVFRTELRDEPTAPPAAVAPEQPAQRPALPEPNHAGGTAVAERHDANQVSEESRVQG